MEHYGLLIVFLIVNLANVQSQILERQQSLHYCRYDVDCNDNSFCSGNTDVSPGRCECKEHYILIGRNRTHYDCVPVADGIDSPCSEDIQCQIRLGTSGSCDGMKKACGCAEGAHLGLDSHCYKTLNIGDFCVSSYNCLLDDGSYGYCVDGKCTCNINHHHSEDGRRCFPSVSLGRSCTVRDSCVQAFANCIEGICRCPVGYVESDNNTLCWKAAAHTGDSCVENIQCSEYIKGSYCENGICVCKNGYHGYGNECVPNAKLGEFCNSDKECILTAELEHSIRCTDRVCVCVEGVSDENSYGCIIVSNGNRISQSFKIVLPLLITVAHYIK